jgi:hypothetical protein
MAEKHYGVANANKSILANGSYVRFTPYDHSAGAWTGFYSTSNKDEQNDLDALVKQKEIFNMTKAEIEDIKKKVPSLRGSTNSQDQLVDQLDPVGAAVKEPDKLPEVNDILNVEKVAKPETKKRSKKRK